MRILVTGGAEANLVDDRLIEKAAERGIDLRSGFVRSDDGRVFITKSGKFPAAHKRGGALRSRIVWWLATGEVVRGGEYDIHHRNQIRTDDRVENLEKIGHGEHCRLHNPKALGVALACDWCGSEYRLPAWRIRQRQKEGRPTRFCSLKCRNAMPQTAAARESRSRGLRAAYAEGRR